MEKLKKAISAILCAVLTFAVGVPAFAAQATLPEAKAETETEIKPIPEIAAMASFFVNAESAATETEQDIISAEENTVEEEIFTETEEEETEPEIPAEEGDTQKQPEENPDGENTDGEPESETPEAENPEIEVPDFGDSDVIIIDDEDTYFEVLKHVLQGAGRNVLLGGLFMGGAVCSPVMMLVFYPVGVALALGGLPVGVLCLAVGVGEFVASPVIALFVDTDTYMGIL